MVMRFFKVLYRVSQKKGPQDFNEIHIIIIAHLDKLHKLQSSIIAHFKAEILPLLEMFVQLLARPPEAPLARVQ